MPNPAFWRAIHSLAHPLTLLSIALLLLNDHLFRIEFPSWWTGKLGDFTWLIFAPLICAAAFAWIIPRRIQHHERLVALSSFGFIGMWFALAKTVPIIHSATMTLYAAITGWQGTLRMDATDLLTLPALLIGWYIWHHADNSPTKLAPRGWILLALGTFATLADLYPPNNYGIYQLCDSDDQLIAISLLDNFRFEYAFYASEDGGLSWEVQSTTDETSLDCQIIRYANPPRVSFDLNDGTSTFRFAAGHRIERSDDNGETWILELDMSEIRLESRRIYYNQRYGNTVYAPGPFDALVDRETGNLIVAMGHDGILVRTSDGIWRWITVGTYRYVNINDLDVTLSLLPYNLILGLAFFLLSPTIILLPLSWDTGVSVALLVVLAGWAVPTFFGPITGAILTLSGVIGIIVIITFVAIMIATLWDTLSRFAPRMPYVFLPIFFASFAASAFFLLPYVLWIRGTIPNYTFASFTALTLTSVVLYVESQHIRHRYPQLFKIKRKPKKDDDDVDDELVEFPAE